MKILPYYVIPRRVWDSKGTCLCEMKSWKVITRKIQIPSLSFLMITLASGMVPIRIPPGRRRADILAKARRARASVDQE